MAANRIVVSEFGTVAHPDPCKTLFQRLNLRSNLFSHNNLAFPTCCRMSSLYQQLCNPSGGDMTDNCAINITPIGDELIAVTEGDYVHQIDSKTLDSVKRV